MDHGGGQCLQYLQAMPPATAPAMRFRVVTPLGVSTRKLIRYRPTLASAATAWASTTVIRTLWP